MSPVTDYVRQILADLTAAGIRATADPRSVNPPCVLITPPIYTLDGFNTVTCDFEALALVPGPANLDAWEAVDTLATRAVRDVLRDVERMTPASYSPDNQPDYTALTLQWQASLCWPDHTP